MCRCRFITVSCVPLVPLSLVITQHRCQSLWISVFITRDSGFSTAYHRCRCLFLNLFISQVYKSECVASLVWMFSKNQQSLNKYSWNIFSTIQISLELITFCIFHLLKKTEEDEFKKIPKFCSVAYSLIAKNFLHEFSSIQFCRHFLVNRNNILCE